MYRACNDCGRPRWWPDARSPGPCGHQLAERDLLSAEYAGRCNATQLVITVRRRSGGKLIEVGPGSTIDCGGGLAIACRLAAAGNLEIRWIHERSAEPESSYGWTSVTGSQALSITDPTGYPLLDADVDLAVEAAPTDRRGGQKCLAALPVGASVDVAPLPDGRLAPAAQGAVLRLVPREDNCLRAVSFDSANVFLNGEPFAAEVIRPGDLVSDRTRCWCWKGIDRGFETPTAEGGFVVAATGLSLPGRVRDFTVSFRSGQLSVVVGGSGSGKTTLVRMIAGILVPTTGSMRLQHNEHSHEYQSHQLEAFAADIAPRVSYIPQDDAVLSELTVRQAIEFAYLLHPANRGRARSVQAIGENVSFLLQATGLESHADKLVERLSGGQRRRVNLALGLVGDPDLVILDEPTTGLDFENERRTMQLLRRLAHQGRSVVVVTHSMGAIRFADQCVVVRPGREGAEIAALIGSRAEIDASEGRISSLIAAPPTRAVATSGDSRKSRQPRPRFIELVARGFRQWMNTPTPALLAFVALPLLLGIMVRLGSGDFRKERLAIGLVAIFWLGINQSVRDLLKDLDVIRREDLDGTSPTRQILARACFAFVTAGIGAVVMTIPLHWFELDGWILKPDTMGQFTESDFTTLLPWTVTIAAFWAAGLMGGLFGLTIASACSFARRKAEALAVLASVIVTLPQFLFSEKCLSDGLAREPEHFSYFFRTWHSESEKAADMLSFLTVTRWTFLPLEAWMDQITGSDIYRLSGIMLGAGAIASLIVASGLLTVSIHVERGAGWLPRMRRRTASRRDS